MPTEVVVVKEKKDMVFGLPYLTRSGGIKKGVRKCSGCNQVIEAKDFKLGVVEGSWYYRADVQLYCTGCMQDRISTTIEGIDEALADLTNLTPQTNLWQIMRSNKGVFPLGIENKNALVKNTPIGQVDSWVQARLDEYLRPELVCQVCGDKGSYQTTEDTWTTRNGYWGSKVDLKVTRTYTSAYTITEGYDKVTNSKREATYCLPHFLARIKEIREEYKTLLDKLPELVPNLEKKFEGLKYPTNKKFFEYGSLSGDNIYRNQKCSECNEPLPKTCSTYTDKDLRQGGMCLKCMRDFAERKVKEYQAVIRNIDGFQEDRCKTCDKKQQIICMTNGWNPCIPLIDLETTGE